VPAAANIAILAQGCDVVGIDDGTIFWRWNGCVMI
jgi:hypothetical protein